MDKQARKMQQDIKKFHKQIITRDYSGLSEEEYKAEIDKQHDQLNLMKLELKERMDKLKQEVTAINDGD